MFDSLNQELFVGDTILYMCSLQHCLRQAKIIKVTKTIKFIGYFGREITLKKTNKVVKINKLIEK